MLPVKRGSFCPGEISLKSMLYNPTMVNIDKSMMIKNNVSWRKNDDYFEKNKWDDDNNSFNNNTVDNVGEKCSHTNGICASMPAEQVP